MPANTVRWFTRPRGIRIPGIRIPRSPATGRPGTAIATLAAEVISISPPTDASTPLLVASTRLDQAPFEFTVDPSTARAIAVAADIDQPWACDDCLRTDSRCGQCNNVLRNRHHYHCCGRAIHIQGKGTCYYRHQRNHFSAGTTAAPASELHKLLIEHRGPAYRVLKKTYCQECLYMGPALEVDHLDGDHTNDDPANLITRCANCHRTKTTASGEHRTRAVRGLPARGVLLG